MAGRLEAQLQSLLDDPVEEAPTDEHSQEEAAYTDEGPAPFVCDNCDYSEGSSCQIVEGEISPSGACRYFAAKVGKPKATAHMMATSSLKGYGRRG